MINVSSEFKELMKQRTDFKEFADITFADGTTLNLTEKDFTVDNNSIADSAGANGLPLGAAVEKTISIELMNDQKQYADYDFMGAKIRLYLKFQLSTSTETVQKGTYTVVSPETYGVTVIVDAADDMYKADVEYDGADTFPLTAGEFLRRLCQRAGITLDSSTFRNSDFVIQEKPTDVTVRELFGYIAMLAGGNARINTSGRLQIIPYDFDYTSGFHELKSWQNLKTGVDDAVITGVQATIKGGVSGQDQTILVGALGYILSIDNPLIAGKESTFLSQLGEWVIGANFRQFEGDMPGNPLIEFMDKAKIYDREGMVYETIITDVNFAFFGLTNVKNSAEDAIRNSSRYTSSATKTYREARKLFEVEKSAREQAIENLANALANSSGLYITKEKQEDGSSIYYMHNKPTLKESDIIWKITAEAFGISTDGGKTYPFGFQVTGEMVAKLLAVKGINASWIRTGVFEVSDKDGNEIMYVDVDTGVVRINAQSLTISGSPVASQQYVQEQVEKLGTLNIILSNDYCSVPVTSDGTIVTGGLSGVDTVVTVLYGTTDITDRVQITITESAGIDGTWSAANKKYTVSSVTTDNAWADFSVTYQGINVVKRFTVAKLYPGEDGEPGKNYQLGSSAVTVRRGKYGVLSPAYVDFTSYYFSGDAVRQPYSGRFAIEESVDGMSWTSRYTSEEDEDAVRCHFYSPMVTSAGLYLSDAQGRFLAALELPEDVIAIRCTLYAAGGTANIIDRQTVSIITDAKSLSAEEYFNLLTDNGRIQGIFMRGDQLFINGEYVQTRGLKAVDENGNTTFYINDKGEVELNVKSLMIAGLGAATQQYAAEQARQVLTDSKTYADSVGQNVNNAINQEEIFNRLFANGAVQGISMQKIGSQYYLYINAEYINSGVIKGIKFESGDGNFEVNSSGELISYSSNGTGQCRIYGGYIRLSGASSDTAQNITITKGSYESSLSEEGAQFRSIGSGGVRTIETNITHSAIYSTGDLSIQGTKNRIVKTPDYDSRLQYCYETPSPMFGDIGQGVTDSSGECYVSIDDIFSETVEQGCEYQVFLQEEGQGDLWVDSKEPTFFIVKGTPSLKFAWELKAKQKRYANERLEIYGLSDHENDLDYKSMFVSDVEKFFKEQEGMYSEEIDQLYVP